MTWEPLARWSAWDRVRFRAAAALVMSLFACLLSVAAALAVAGEHFGWIAPARPTVVLQTVIVRPSPTPTAWPWP